MRWVFVLTAAFTVWGVVKKPAFFWEHHKVRTMRGIFGDTGAMVFYIGLAFFLAGLGIFGLGN